MKRENSHCRPMTKRMADYHGWSWITNPNMTYRKGGSGIFYESGRPDAFINAYVHLDIECKYACRSLYFGNPDNEEDTSGWHFHQRKWYENMSTFAQYWIVLMMDDERNPRKALIKNSAFWMLTASEWIIYERLVFDASGLRSVGMTREIERRSSLKDLNVVDYLSRYKLINDSGTRLIIPDSHIFWALNPAIRRIR